MEKILEMRQKRAKLIKLARELVDRAEEEKRPLTAEEEQQYSKIMSEVEELRKAIEREERLYALEKEITQPRGTVAAGKDQPGDGRSGQLAEETRAAFDRFLRAGVQALDSREIRALQAGVDTAGGYLVPPQYFVNQLIKAIDDMVFIRPLATKFVLDRAESLGVPVLESDISDADWTSELATGTEDTTMAFGKRELTPHPLAKRIRVSNKLLRQSAIDVEALVRDRLAYKFAVAEEKAFLMGDGVGKPLGVFTVSDQGIDATRDVVVGTDVTMDGLIAAKYALKQQYWRRAAWLFHRSVVERIAKLKDERGQYIWRESTRVGEPDRLLGFPVLMSEYAPHTFATGEYIGILGDFSAYWIVEALDMQIQRLTELYAEANQVGFIARREVDGMPVLKEAFVRLKLA